MVNTKLLVLIAAHYRFPIASRVRLRYRSSMKRGIKYVRCPTEDFRRLQFAATPSEAGFSLIELLAVAAILLLLFTLYWGSSASDNQQRQAQKECQVHLQKIHMAMEIYANDHAGKFPEAPGARTSEEALDTLVPRYTVDTAAFICPGSKDPPLPAGLSFRQHRISYAYYMGRRATEPQQVLMTTSRWTRNPGAPANTPSPARASPRGTTTANWAATSYFAMAVPNRLPFGCPSPPG